MRFLVSKNNNINVFQLKSGLKSCKTARKSKKTRIHGQKNFLFKKWSKYASSILNW